MRSSRTLIAVLVVATLAALAVAGVLKRRSGPERPPDILLITVDTLRPDHLSLYGYPRETSPNLDRFFAKGEIYERVYSAEANTSPSVVSLLTGLYPAQHGVRLFFQQIEDEILTLPDRLRAHGYQTAAVVSNLVLTAEAIGLDRRFDHYDDFVDEREGGRDVFERRASRTTDAALEWLSTKRDRKRPFFLWVHYIDPHGPYLAPEDKPVDFTHDEPVQIDASLVPRYERIPGQMDDGLEYVDRYDEEIAYVDREIGRLLTAYDKLGLADDSIVAFTADHGETMFEHDKHFSHGYHVWESIMRVPLAIRRPDAEARRVSKAVSLVDLPPTLLAYAGLDVPDDFDGHVLEERPDDEPISLEATIKKHQLRAAVLGSDKWFALVDHRGRIVKRWYADLETDGDKETKRKWGAKAGGEPLEEWVKNDPDPGGIPREYQKGVALKAPKVAPGRSPKQLEALKALGYVE